MMLKMAFFAVLGILFMIEVTFIVNYINGIQTEHADVFFMVGVVFVYMLICMPDFKKLE